MTGFNQYPKTPKNESIDPEKSIYYNGDNPQINLLNTTSKEIGETLLDTLAILANDIKKIEKEIDTVIDEGSEQHEELIYQLETITKEKRKREEILSKIQTRKLTKKEYEEVFGPNPND